MKRRRYDVVVVGARVAGAATAMLLARHGVRVLAVDRSRYGSDTLSTQAIMRGGVLQLERWGVMEALRAFGTPAIRKTSFHYGEEEVEVAIKPRDGVDGLYAPRRHLLDKVLVDHAVASGAVVQHGGRLVDIARSASGRVSGVVIEDERRFRETIDCEMVIGADGARSTVAELMGAEVYRSGRNATGVVYGYWEGLEIPDNHWYFRPGVSAGLIPTNGRQTLVFIAVPAKRFMEETRFDLEGGYRAVLEACSPTLSEALGRASLVGRLRGFAGRTGFFRRSAGPGWALVGDAGYFKDPITAHGMTDALRDAELVASAVSADTEDTLRDYERARDELSVPLFEITDRIASLAPDVDELKALHLAMSKEMNREVDALLSRDPVPVVLAAPA